MSSTPAATAPSHARARGLEELWTLGRPAVMGILNCTPDSFSDGGCFLDPDRAIAHGLSMLDGGAEIIDVGGESTRPYSEGVAAAMELERVLPVIEGLRRSNPQALLSIDTSKAEVAAAALAAGADLVNDVSGGRDQAMFELVAETDAAIILMHMRGTPQGMQARTSYDHVVAEVHAHLRQRARLACSAGIEPERVWLDPGIGFGKDDEGNLALLAALPELAACGHPVVLGPSRKSFIGRLTGATVDDRLPGTLAALVPALRLHRAVVRVHEPAAAVQFLHIAASIQGAAA